MLIAKTIKIAACLAACLVLGELSPSLANSEVRSRQRCEFKLSSKGDQDFLEKVLSRHLGESYLYYDVPNAAVTRHGNHIDVLLSPVKTIHGRRMLTENTFEILFDACTHKVFRTNMLEY